LILNEIKQIRGLPVICAHRCGGRSLRLYSPIIIDLEQCFALPYKCRYAAL